MELFFDVTRLFERVRRRVASGIDRVELEYVLYLLRSPRVDARWVRWGDDGLEQVPTWLVRTLAAYLCWRWYGEELAPAALRRAGIHPAVTAHAAPVLARIARRRRLLGVLVGLASPLVERDGRGAPCAYVNTSHKNLSRLREVRRSFARPVRVAVMLHDIMPVSHPEFFPELQDSFRAGARHVVDEADVIVVNSEHTRTEVVEFAERESLTPKELCVSRLGVGEVPSRWAPREEPYFVFLGTLAPRKNIELLLRAWCVLAAEDRPLPALHLVGGESERLHAMTLALPERVQGAISIHDGLEDAKVSHLIAGARALLMPSRVEGFGLPVAEALAMNVPVVCSDLPVFREFGDAPEFVSLEDLAGWVAAIARLSEVHEGRSENVLPPVRSWDDHIEDALTAILGT